MARIARIDENVWDYAGPNPGFRKRGGGGGGGAA